MTRLPGEHLQAIAAVVLAGLVTLSAPARAQEITVKMGTLAPEGSP